MEKIEVKPNMDPPNPGFRFYLGLGIFILSVFILPIGIFLQQFTNDHFWKAFILAIFWASAPVMKVSSIAIMGKPSYLYIKFKFWHIFVKVTKPHEVSRLRYNIGLVMFFLPVIPNYIMSYAPDMITDAYHFRLIINISIDAIFICSLFVLGGDFWDKLRALFTYKERVKVDNVEEKI